MSLYAANNIAKGIRRLARRGDTGLAGVICNSTARLQPGYESFEQQLLQAFAEALGTTLMGVVPHSPIIQACEVEGRTVIAHSPQTVEADLFRSLAQKMMDNTTRIIPTPVDDITDLEALYRGYIPQSNTGA